MIGRSGFSRYLGYLLRDDLVLLENIDYGNALYMMFDDWKTLSKRSRLDLLSDPTAHYERVLHKVGWEKLLNRLLSEHGFTY